MRLVPEALVGRLLVVSVVFLVSLGLIVCVNYSFAFFLILLLGLLEVIVLENVQVAVFPVQLALESGDLLLGFFLGERSLLLKHLSVSGDLHGVIQGKRFANFPTGCHFICI